jgi:hypothetical protein
MYHAVKGEVFSVLRCVVVDLRLAYFTAAVFDQVSYFTKAGGKTFR